MQYSLTSFLSRPRRRDANMDGLINSYCICSYSSSPNSLSIWQQDEAMHFASLASFSNDSEFQHDATVGSSQKCTLFRDMLLVSQQNCLTLIYTTTVYNGPSRPHYTKVIIYTAARTAQYHSCIFFLYKDAPIKLVARTMNC